MAELDDETYYSSSDDHEYYGLNNDDEPLVSEQFIGGVWIVDDIKFDGFKCISQNEASEYINKIVNVVQKDLNVSILFLKLKNE